MTGERMVVLVHGGLWEDMDADRFWSRPGIVAGLAAAGAAAGVAVLAPDRLRRAPDWTAEADHLAAALPSPPPAATPDPPPAARPDHPVTVVAGSNGCSAAVRLVLARPGRVQRLLLAWPATAGDSDVDSRTRTGLAGLGATAASIERLLGGATLRGVTDHELAGLRLPVGVLPSVPTNPPHQRRTVDALLGLIPGAVELPGCPEPPRPDFAPHRDSFVATVLGFVRA